MLPPSSMSVLPTISSASAPSRSRSHSRWLFLLLASSISSAIAADFHVAPHGDDTNLGTREKPFASLLRAQQAMSPGDTTWIGGGTYRIDASDIARQDAMIASVFPLDKSGRKDQPLRYFATPGERPVFECSALKPEGLRIYLFRTRGSWIHLKGIEVTGVQVNSTGHTQSICFENTGSHNTFEGLSMHDGQAIGLYISRGTGNLVLNCDAWNNHDHTSENGRGGNTDGFGSHVPHPGTENTFRGCRAWLNSDDGFDCISSGGTVIFENCWAFRNGYDSKNNRLGDGNGFKAGGYGIETDTRFPNPVPRHRISRCLAVSNRSNGFYANHHPGGSDWIHNSAYRNSTNFNFLGRSQDASRDVPGSDHFILNNLSYGTRHHLREIDLTQCRLAGNTFTSPAKVTDSHFLSLDESLLSSPRKPNGDLPEIPFLRLAPGNPWIDQGHPPGHPQSGQNPDPGAFETR